MAFPRSRTPRCLSRTIRAPRHSHLALASSVPPWGLTGTCSTRRRPCRTIFAVLASVLAARASQSCLLALLFLMPAVGGRIALVWSARAKSIVLYGSRHLPPTCRHEAMLYAACARSNTGFLFFFGLCSASYYALLRRSQRISARRLLLARPNPSRTRCSPAWRPWRVPGPRERTPDDAPAPVVEAKRGGARTRRLVTSARLRGL